MNRITIKTPNKIDYDVVLNNSFDQLEEEFNTLGLTDRKALIITDSIVGPIYSEQIIQIIGKCNISAKVYTFHAGEESKTSETVFDIYDFLLENNYTRSDLIIALGGGVTGDMAGYVAATYRRGLNFVSIPTSLLAMVDSSVGGKTAVDYNGYKNMIGAFYNPKLVYANISVLNTLEERHFYNGFAEVMKSAIIKDAHFYEWLIEMMYEICDKDYDTLEELILKTITIKKLIVEKDPYENGDRALLNLGHTIGHAIESTKIGCMLHGECVALGIVAAAHISYKKNMLSMDEYLEIRDMFVPFNLPITIDDIDKDLIINNITKDKKQDNEGLKFVLLKRIGKACIDRSVTTDEIMEALKEIEYIDELD
ncbi:MAG: 3-dehydroquinate synthase [Lachnospiraceae bacterium]|nr:3-dehydroquinate synthase [Candidatus Colinaster equi]